MYESAFPLCEDWRADILAQMTADGRAAIPTSYSGVGTAAWDDVCGQLVVSPERVYRSVQFPLDAVEAENCYVGQVAVDLLCTLVRCVPVLDDLGRPPSPDALSGAHRAILEDAASIWRAVSQPLVDPEHERASVTQLFVGGEGGAVGVETRWTIGLDAVDWCPAT